MFRFIVFSDLKGFTKFAEDQDNLRVFYKEILPDLAAAISKYKEQSLVWNTWGDAIVAVFESVSPAVSFMLDYRDFFKQLDLKKYDIKVSLQPRIAAHCGEVEEFEDPLLHRRNALGKHINTAARIEPVTRSGEIFVTKFFREAIKEYPGNLDCSLDYLGVVPLAKSFGDQELFRLYRSTESPQVIDQIFAAEREKNLPWPLPTVPKLTEQEEEKIARGKRYPDQDGFSYFVTRLNLKECSGRFILEIAELCKQFGLYEKALELAEEAEKCSIEVDDMHVFPVRQEQSLIKLKANCYTRLGKYSLAADLIYDLWQSGMKDSDTLSMLAAQYKRKALFTEDGKIKKNEEINLEHLDRAKRLYIEAFRQNIEDYYPAINVAYLLKMKGYLCDKRDFERGTRLADYIIASWKDRPNKDWWLSSTLAEAELIRDNIEEAETRLKVAIGKCNPGQFEKKSVYDQISLYAKVRGMEILVKDILESLRK